MEVQPVERRSLCVLEEDTVQRIISSLRARREASLSLFLGDNSEQVTGHAVVDYLEWFRRIMLSE